MQNTYRTVEHVLLVALAIPPDGRSSLAARIKRFGQLGLPPSARVGKNNKAKYNLQDTLDLALALTILRGGVSPQLVASFILASERHLAPLWAKARDENGPIALAIRVDTMADPAAVVRGGGEGSLLRGAELTGPWDETDDRPLAVTHIDLTDLLSRVVDAMRAVRVARIVVVNKSLSDDAIEDALADLDRSTI